ncbi:C40 family peptidase [Agrococcus sp. Marseille-Q4369]|uniref:C40 family peptidase n=1 Tax=Agrococcus sp. Marseille-Q4369 TaxID=2810513 RepID=UPI001B8C88BF|nr:C40 family peptidase [Agrococcus sp. Marseille-Q4369]QUW19856.1 C40 family peptidase [Agrococcus sp. Marseille-Q4369]
MGQHSTTAIAVSPMAERGAPASAMTSSLRKGAKSFGVVCVAAGLVGALSLPAAAFAPQSESYSQAELASIVAENSQSVSVSEDARVELVARDGISGTTAAELEEIRTAAREAEEARQAELAEARAELAATAAAAGTASAATTAAAAGTASTATTAAAALPVNAPPANGSIVGIAQSQLGVPYVWGGSSPATGFDCSGFTKWVYGQAGHYLPHSSNAQAGYGSPVSASAVAAGDLLVWSGHVAIYVGGNQIIHAATSGKPVKYSSYSAMVAAFGTPQVRRF